MSDTPESPQEPQPTPKKVSFSALLPAKVPVETSLGRLYVRHAYTSDWKYFENDDAQELGRAAVRQLSNRVENKNDNGPLAEDDLETLIDADFVALAPVISKQSGWGNMPTGAGLKELGEAIKTAKEREIKRKKKELADMRKSLGSSYGFLGNGVLEKLQAQMAGLTDMRSAMSGADPLRAAMLASSQMGNTWGGGLASKNAFEKPVHALPPEQNVGRVVVPPVIMPPRPEDSPLGRATLESAETVREVAQNMNALVDVVTGLNQTLIMEVFPAWFKQVNAGQESSKKALEQTASGLWWTKWAVIVSVVVTVLTTWWQVSVATGIDRGNTEQQKQAEEVMREQLKAQQKLIEQQARDAAAMREIIAALKPLAPVAAPKK